MTNWDRIQRMEVEKATLDAKVNRLEVDLHRAEAGLKAMRQQVDALCDENARHRDLWQEAVQERDRARDIAVALEQELAQVVRVPYLGEAT